MKKKTILSVALLAQICFAQTPTPPIQTPTIWLRWDSVISAAAYRIYELTPTQTILLTQTVGTVVCFGDASAPTNQVKNPEPARGFYARNAQNDPGFFRVASAVNISKRRAFVLYHVNPEGSESAPVAEISFPFTPLEIPFGEWRLKGGDALNAWTLGRSVTGTSRVALFVNPQNAQGFLTFTNQ